LLRSSSTAFAKACVIEKKKAPARPPVRCSLLGLEAIEILGRTDQLRDYLFVACALQQFVDKEVLAAGIGRAPQESQVEGIHQIFLRFLTGHDLRGYRGRGDAIGKLLAKGGLP